MDKVIKVAAIGIDDHVYLFNTAGFKTIKSNDPEYLDRAIFELVSEDYLLIFIDERLLAVLAPVFAKYQHKAYPVFTALNFTDEESSRGLDKIYENVEKAIGFNIFRKDE